ncbi:helix-turn-helix domain-containing protein [Myxococcus fulvus]|uniref:helix-turn-helix domain-containing protein n=1 Tax=Myxococcus fulvus TaxID=33 RepID=UPI0020BDBA73|nr:AraC family transcriptional regulator [Myxococcus fulvus]MCK8504069.1 AraC family transcriptional regulator [Myxococcus fulvus]
MDGQAPITLQEGDFVLPPATPGFTISGFEPVMAERVGYSSASTFTTAFSRHVGQSPGRYARAS